MIREKTRASYVGTYFVWFFLVTRLLQYKLVILDHLGRERRLTRIIQERLRKGREKKKTEVKERVVRSKTMRGCI